MYIIIYTIQIRQCGIHEGSYVSSYCQQLSVTPTQKSPVNMVASKSETPV